MISVIVPVYNSEKTLERCVRSLQRQTAADLEIILVDDGSTDGSRLLVSTLAREDARIRVIHKENGGVSSARNAGIEAAKGEYLMFTDSDDYVEPEMAEKMLEGIGEDDIAICGFHHHYQGRDIVRIPNVPGQSGEENFLSLYGQGFMNMPWNKLYRREIIEKHHLQMNAEISWCEDFMFNLEYIRFAERFCVLHAPVYYYVKRKGSLVSQGNSLARTIQMKLTVFGYYHSFYKEVLDEEEYEKKRLQVYRFLVDAAGDGAVGIPFLPGTKRLGDERAGVSADAIEGEGVLSDLYRERKLLERYLEAAALKCGLTVPEMTVLLYLSHSEEIITRKELADFAGISRRTLGMQLQRLAMRGLICQEELTAEPQEEKKKDKAKKKEKARKKKEQKEKKDREKRLRISFLPAAEPILEELAVVEWDYDNARFGGFDEEELIQYTRLAEKMKRNMQRILSPGRSV